LFVGVDIAARTFTASQLKPSGELCLALSFKQDSDDYTQLQKWLLVSELTRILQPILKILAVNSYERLKWSKICSGR
jgi:hypothetical protein